MPELLETLIPSFSVLESESSVVFCFLGAVTPDFEAFALIALY
jgi:hypothetical protein